MEGAGMGTVRNPASTKDERFMRLALREAARGVGQTSPNPAVGALIVRGGKVLSRGYHRAAGQPHAEIEALRALKNPAQARGATIYVTLEPCSTHGRTGACTDAIQRAGFARVVVGATDPNPAHAGRGLRILERAGLAVEPGVLADECTRLNRAFNRWIVTGRPWVIAKAAITLDGRLTRPPGEDRWLSGPAARAHAHQQRARVDAILIGAGTLRADNPRLTVRLPGKVGTAVPAVCNSQMIVNSRQPPGRQSRTAGDSRPYLEAGAWRPPSTPESVVRQPWRVVVTRRGDLPPAAHLFTDEWRDRTLVFRDQPFPEVLRRLGERQVTSVLIEGGGGVLRQAFEQDLVDAVQIYFTPWIAGGPVEAVAGAPRAFPLDSSLCNCRYERVGPDVLLTAEIDRSST